MALSKNFALRLPPDLWEKIQALAHEKDRSANWVILDLIRKGLTIKDDATKTDHDQTEPPKPE